MSTKTAEQPDTLRLARSLADFRTHLSDMTPRQWGRVAQCAIEWLREIRANNAKLAFELVNQQASISAERLPHEAIVAVNDVYQELIVATPPAINQLLSVNAAIPLLSLDPRDRQFFRPFEEVLDFNRLVDSTVVRLLRNPSQNCTNRACPYVATHVHRNLDARNCDYHLSAEERPYYISIEALPASPVSN